MNFIVILGMSVTGALVAIISLLVYALTKTEHQLDKQQLNRFREKK